jgi:predicted nuclease with RNAse H fold
LGKATGFCVLIGKRAETKILFSDLEIMREVEKEKPAMVAIDAPLNLPRKGSSRNIEKVIRAMKIRIFLPLFFWDKEVNAAGNKAEARFAEEKLQSNRDLPRSILRLNWNKKKKESQTANKKV